ncbi:MAG TPA: LacI family transcriptional regulator [Firmicutes bacterium]|nr:LacI family transcriptional regulator [Bacillota bacterium]
MKKDVTIKDVAKRAGVAPSTVSRVLTNSPGVGPKTREQIKRILREMGYRPNAAARGLVHSKNQAIGLVVPCGLSLYFGNPYFTEVVSGIAETAATRGYHLVLYTPPPGEGAGPIITDRRTDAFIVMGTKRDDPLLPMLQEWGVPVVLINRRQPRLPGIYCVDAANEEGGRLGAQFLAGRGIEEVAVLMGPRDAPVAWDRYQGFVLECERLQLHITAELEGEFLENRAYELVRELIGTGRLPQAFFAVNDMMAIGCLRACRDLGVKVPQEVSVLGFDDIQLATFVTPSLTTIRLPTYAMGAEAARVAIRGVEGESAEELTVLPVELVERASVR